MHWSDRIAAQVISRNPDKEEYICAAGISPSGSIHIGNFRDIATSLFVVKAIRRQGKKAKLLFSWDEYDRLRKIPVNVAAVDPDMEVYRLSVRGRAQSLRYTGRVLCCLL